MPQTILKYAFFLVSVAVFFSLKAQNFPHPTGIMPYKFESKRIDTAAHWLLVSPFKLNDKTNATPVPFILDENGYIAWYWSGATGKLNNDFHYFESAKKFGWMNIYANGEIYYLFTDAHFKKVDTLKNANSVVPDGHEIQLLANGHYLIGGKSFRNYDAKNRKFTTEKADSISILKAEGYMIQEFDADKKLLFQWDSNDHLVPDKFIDKYDFSLKNFDYCHGNAIAIDQNGDFLVSFRNFDAIYKIRRATGEVVWKLGGKSNDFRFVNDEGFSGQHHIRILPNGDISLYDNATQKPAPQSSRPVIYRLDTNAMTATKVFDFEQKVFGKSLGSYQNLNDQYHLINYGFIFRPSPSISLINEKKETIFNLYFADSVVNYRAQIADIKDQFARPKIKAKKKKGYTELSTPKRQSQYLWSNGETTRRIRVREKGSYQVWIPKGIGMIGSQPYHLK